MKIPIMGKGVTLTEIPNEIAVFFEVGNCRQQCKGCHSPDLWTDWGADWWGVAELLDYIKSQKGATAVVFMGGTTNYDIDPRDYLEKIIAPISKEYAVGLYHGDETYSYDESNLTWLKLGRYDEVKGGLDSPTTNQKFLYKVPNGKWINITSYFTKETNGEKITK